MHRNLDALANGRFDLAIIGGGVVGACLARDAARRGLAVALVEADDFAGATSEAMSHFVHGGIRYLAQGRIGTVVESLRERAVWRRIAPHLVADQTFLFPLSTRQSRRKRLELRIGVALFEALARRGLGHRLSRTEAIAAEPSLDDPALTGALVYADCRVDFPERAVLALLSDAVHSGATIANHAEADSLRRENGRVAGIVIADRLGGGRLTIRARAIVNAAGPWSGIVADRLAPGQCAMKITLSKGIHLVTPPVARTHALAFAGDGEHAFLTPWRGFNIVGTTDEAFVGQPRGVVAEPAERDRLVAKVEKFLPGARLAVDQAVSSFAAIRAIPGVAGDTYGAARDAVLADHAADGADGFFSLTGGKWTTARAMAETALDRIVARCGLTARACDTATSPLRAAPDDEAAFRAHWRERLAAFPVGEADDWISCHGQDIGRVVARIAPGGEGDPDARDEARFAEAADHEMAQSPADLVRRLTRSHALVRPGVHDHAARWLANRRKADQVSTGA
ncbi:MAG: glycerol-3-phosphate dehydrogenase/oxidase [Phyllobacteriaceae bacterium]|nr:glycerol-3-phosphate dehydrogenase/oxidase [Phyllobacteriaceae bacterium]